MSMPIQRQSEQFSIFDDGPRYARDRSSTDLPKGLAGLINSTGPRIQAGLLNTRTAVNVDGMHPDDHAYHTELPPGPGGEIAWADDAESFGRNPRREWNPDFGYEPTDEDERRSELIGEDDESGYNWGPEPRRASRRPFDRAAAGRLAACQECDDDVLPREGDWEHVNGPSDHLANPDEDDIANDEYGEGLDPARGMDAYKQHREMMGRRVALAPAPQDPAMALQVPVGGGFQAGHRVGLDWRDRTISGTVIANDGQVHIRWDEGQYTSEDPSEVHLL